jgi:hypothetical protein
VESGSETMFKQVPKKTDKWLLGTRKTESKCPYCRPTVRTISKEQGILILVELAWAGDEQANKFLRILFPMPE